jgi:hypothetical protein
MAAANPPSDAKALVSTQLLEIRAKLQQHHASAVAQLSPSLLDLFAGLACTALQLLPRSIGQTDLILEETMAAIVRSRTQLAKIHQGMYSICMVA